MKKIYCLTGIAVMVVIQVFIVVSNTRQKSNNILGSKHNKPIITTNTINMTLETKVDSNI